MVQNLNLLLRSGYQLALKTVRQLPAESATVLRQAALQLIAYDLLAVFHRSEATAVHVKVDYSPENAEDRYEVSARNGFFDIDGDTRSAQEHGLRDTNMPLELMSSEVFSLHRDDPLVQLSLSDDPPADRLLHHRVVQQLATELDIFFPFP